jgi:O-antigen/teichoic acid export membrane protein
MIVMSLSAPIVNTLFGETYSYAPLFLTLYFISNLYAVAGSLTLSSFLTGLGETRMLVKQAVLTLVIGIILAFFLIPNFGIFGAVIGSIVGALLAGVPSLVWGLHWIWKHYEAKAELGSSLKILAASVLAAIVSFLTTIVLQTHAWIQLVIGTAIFLITYILAAPLIGAVTQSDIDTLRIMFSGLGAVSKIVNVPLRVAERAAKFKSANKKAGKES